MIKIKIAIASLVSILCLGIIWSVDISKADTEKPETVEIINMSRERPKDNNSSTYISQFEISDKKEETKVTNVQKSIAGYNGKYVETEDTGLSNYAREIPTKADEELIKMSEEEAWIYFSDGMISKYPTVPFSDVKGILSTIQRKHLKSISVKVWFWTNPNDTTDMSKTSKTIKLSVHDRIASLYIKVFDAIYKSSDKPVININDKGMGTWVIRGKNHNDYNTLSAHSMGTAIDINPSTGSVSVDGVIYGNGYGNKMMSKELWDTLPENHTKYQILYNDCTIVKAFKSFGFYWGGDWSTADSMHLSFIGDLNGRSRGVEAYTEYGGTE